MIAGAIAGALSAILFFRRDPLPPRKRYSWEDEEDEAEPLSDDELEPPSPQRVPVLWQPREGGHVGFAQGALPPGDVFWLPRAVGGWLLEHA